MGLTITEWERRSIGNEWEVRCKIAFDASYPAGGESLTPAMLNLDRITDLRAEPKSGYAFEYDHSGHLLKAYRTVATAEVRVGSFSFQNILGADADVSGSMTADQNAGPTNDDQIDTFHAVSAGAWAYSEDNEIDVPRNVAIVLYNDSGGEISMEEAEFKAVVTGTFRGAAQTDTISETFTSGNKAIANTKYRWKYGVKPFEKITSVVITGLTTSQNSLKIGVGLGRLLGVPQDPKDGVAGDFFKVLKAGADHAVVAYSNANKALDLGAITDDDDFDIWFEAPMGEITDAGDLSGLTGVRVTARGL